MKNINLPSGSHWTPQEFLIVIGLGFALAISFGFAYGISNQNTYLIGGLRFIDPDFLQYDWFATATTHYHDTFKWIIWGIDKIMPLSIGTVALNTLLIVSSVFALYSLLRSYCENNALLPMFALVAIMMFTNTWSVANSYIFVNYLQPSSIAAAFFILALVTYLRAYYLISGVMLALSGVFHTNFLLLGLLTFGIAHIGMGRSDFFSRTLRQMLPATLYFLYLLPGLLELASSPDGEQARTIFQNNASGHYIPLTFLDEFLQYGSISLLGFAFFGLDKPKDQGQRHSLLAIFSSMVLVVTIASLLTTIVFVPFVSQLFPWRLAPFSNLLASVIVAMGLVSLLRGRVTLSRKRLLAASAGLLGASTFYFFRSGLAIGYATIISTISIGTIAVLWRLVKKQNWEPPLIANVSVALLFVAAAIATYPKAYKHSYFIDSVYAPAKNEFYNWIRTQTPIQAQVLTPPKLEEFRLLGHRAIVVDWKSMPIIPIETIEWRDRITAVTGSDDISPRADANEGYATMSKERLDSLVSRYELDFAVFFARDVANTDLGKIVFENRAFVVIDTSP